MRPLKEQEFCFAEPALVGERTKLVVTAVFGGKGSVIHCNKGSRHPHTESAAQKLARIRWD